MRIILIINNFNKYNSHINAQSEIFYYLYKEHTKESEPQIPFAQQAFVHKIAHVKTILKLNQS